MTTIYFCSIENKNKFKKKINTLLESFDEESKPEIYYNNIK